ncbi:hypothetical protein RB597_002493 [Gaeumannomyces tritici]
MRIKLTLLFLGLAPVTWCIIPDATNQNQHPVQLNITNTAPLLPQKKAPWPARPPKYFREASFHQHYDRRFGKRVLGYNEQKIALKNLLQTYLATFADLGLETWLMHGSLLGWWWNKGIMPWDSDVDVQVTESTMYYLAAFYNMSIWHYQTPRIPEGVDYLLDINPGYKNPSRADKMNKIDARWIDTSTGLFIDITSVRYNLSHPKGKGMLGCKDGHEFMDTYIFPLRDSTFENSPVKIPYRYRDLLAAEYGEKSLINGDFKGHLFDDKRMEWVPKPGAAKPPARKAVAKTSNYQDKKSPAYAKQEEKRKAGELKAIEKAQLRQQAWEKRRLARLKADMDTT